MCSIFILTPRPPFFSFFFFNDTATTEIYTLSLHDALPISNGGTAASRSPRTTVPRSRWPSTRLRRSEEHTSELQSQSNLVCRLLLEKKKKNTRTLCQPDKTSRLPESDTTVILASAIARPCG